METISEWAEREIKLACEKDNPDEKGFNYMCACYQSAYRAFKELMKDGHSGMSMAITQNILNRLIDGKPLTPITDEDFFKYDVGIKEPDSYLKECGLKSDIQCGRMSSLFRKETLDGKVTYNDVDRVIFYDKTDDGCWHNNFVSKLIDERFPITMPYFPPAEPYKVYGESKYLDENGNDVTEEHVGEYNYIRYDYVITPEGKRVELNIERRE